MIAGWLKPFRTALIFQRFQAVRRLPDVADGPRRSGWSTTPRTAKSGEGIAAVRKTARPSGGSRTWRVAPRLLGELSTDPPPCGRTLVPKTFSEQAYGPWPVRGAMIPSTRRFRKLAGDCLGPVAAG